MNHQTVIITMPEPLYQRLQKWSTVIQRPLENVVLQTLQTTLPKLPEELSKHPSKGCYPYLSLPPWYKIR